MAQPGEDELEALVRQHARLVYRIAFSVLRNLHDAEDAVQDVFMRVLRSRYRLRDVSDPAAYLARIAWHVALDAHRRQKEISIDTSPSGASLEQIASDRQIMRFVEGAIAELPADLRDAVTLAAVEELSAAEAAEVLGVAEAPVRTRVFRARHLLLRPRAPRHQGANRRVRRRGHRRMQLSQGYRGPIRGPQHRPNGRRDQT